MVFPPFRKLPERNLGPRQPAGGRREPQVDLSGLGKQAPAEEPFGQQPSPPLPSLPPVPPPSDVWPPLRQTDASAAIDEDDIPTLTEVVEIGPSGAAAPADAPLPADAGTPDRLRSETGIPRPDGGPPEPDRQQTEEVLQRLLRRPDLLETRLQQALTPVMERATAAIARELHGSLERIIREVVALAVSEELNRLRSEPAERDRSSRT